MPRESHSNEGLSHSLTDLMTSIAVIFILLFLVFVQSQQAQNEKRLNQTKTNRQKLFESLKGAGFGDQVKVESDKMDPLTVLVVVSDESNLLSFETNKYDVNSSSEAFLREFIPKLSQVICVPEINDALDSVIIEGHTDTNGEDDHNTGLSAQRATEVFIHSRIILAATPIPPGSDLLNLESCFLEKSQATGRGERDLIRDPATNLEDEKKSRRVVVKLRVKSQEQREDLNPGSESGGPNE